MVPCFPLLGLTPSGLFMGLSSTIIYTSELILCSTICVPFTRANAQSHRGQKIFSLPRVFPFTRANAQWVIHGFKARFIRRIFAVSNAIETIDNEIICFIIYSLNCIRHGRNATSEGGLSSTIIYTSELILCSSICVPDATRHNTHMCLFDSSLANHKLSYISKYISVTYALDSVHDKIDV